MKQSLICTYIMNLIDWALTASYISVCGLSIEANPLMRLMYRHEPLAFICKAVIIGLLLLLIWKFRKKMSAKIGTAIITAVYSALTIYHAILIIQCPQPMLNGLCDMLSRLCGIL